MFHFTNKEILSGNDPLNFKERKGCVMISSEDKILS